MHWLKGFERLARYFSRSRLVSNRKSKIGAKLLSSLGVTLFQALDYGFAEEEERSLDTNLERLIERLATAESSSADGEGFKSLEDDKDSKDEGIERDSPDDENDANSHPSRITVDDVIEMCISHLSCPEQADNHYKAVCRALVAETLELSTFLEKISKGTKELRKSSVVVVNEKLLENNSNLDDLRVADWARLWMQVIRELRRGVKLKKVDLNAEHRVEYELTPYEMLLDDIRLRRYKLKKVMVNGDIPQRVKKDAHALILEFIRSRPPLVPASKRQLPPPPPKQQTLYEKLMQSIRQEHKLKPTPPSSAKQSPIHLGRVTKG
ncbi:hypothetical protein B4U79_07547 [Dinothrombium tinctorium]|uniref:KIND domain-containing protein n=1 Tax=Dinothrombium tinctorium TaxID=1965070 RepID=A0A3S3PGU0_9ACAR|nr:hypothetical protein B4U79_07547 [Dinothrombium tinctorium]